MAISQLEELLELQLEELNLSYEREYKFDSSRRWRVDFVLHEYKIAIEVEGGTWVNGRHNRASSIEADMDKYNALAIHGWTLLRFSGSMIKSGKAVTVIQNAIQKRRDEA